MWNKVFLSSTIFLSTSLFASAPLQKTQAPGFYRMMVGAFEVTVINDGTLDLPMDQLLSEDKAKTLEALKAHHLKTPVETSVNSFLVNTGKKLVLIDAGTGGFFGPTAGRFLANLKAAGYKPSDIDEIYITHLHPDHVGGVSEKGKRSFPNAILRAHEEEAKFWLSKDNLAKAPDANKPFFQGAQTAVEPYQEADKFKTFGADSELVPGVKSMSSLGHTPGHTSYMVESNGEKFLILGDLIHVASVQFNKPSITIAYDGDPKTAATARAKVFNEVAKNQTLVGAAHLSFPGLGWISGDDKRYDFIPMNYSRGPTK